MLRQGFLILFTAVALAGCDDYDNPTEPSDSNTVVFTAQLSPANEVPPITNAEANAKGDVKITFNLTRDSANNVTGATAQFVVNLSNFPAGTPWTRAHIHKGNSGTAGGISIDSGLDAGIVTTPIVLTNGSISNQQLTSPAITDVALINDIISNPSGYYFNLHTSLNPTGAVRGQLVKQ